MAQETSWTSPALSPGTGHRFKITAFDDKGIESPGRTLDPCATWLPNPSGLTVDIDNGAVDLYWDPTQPSNLVLHYAVYMSEAGGFSDASDMTPMAETTQPHARIDGLENGARYDFAVAAVNVSNGFDPAIVSVPAVPNEDVSGPELSNIEIDGREMKGGHVLFKSSGGVVVTSDAAAITLTADDPSGVDRVLFFLDPTDPAADPPLCTDNDGASGYECQLDITGVSYGDHRLLIRAFDALGNRADREADIVVAEPLDFECFQGCVQ